MVIWRLIIKYKNEIEPDPDMLSFIKRKAENYIEVDFKSNSLKIIDRVPRDFISMDIIKWEPQENMKRDPMEIYDRFVKFVNDEEYWYAHEEVERFWDNETGKEKENLRSIILLMASMVHYQMGHEESSKRLYKDSLDYLLKSSILKKDYEFSYPANRELISCLMYYLHRYACDKQYKEDQTENQHCKNNSFDCCNEA